MASLELRIRQSSPRETTKDMRDAGKRLPNSMKLTYVCHHVIGATPYQWLTVSIAMIAYVFRKIRSKEQTRFGVLY